jgi:hypothetical protein
MKRERVLILLLLLAILAFSCGNKVGETVINVPNPIEDKDKIFRGGYGLVEIVYTPPPPPIFELNNYVEALDFEKIRKEYGIPDKPVIVEYTVDLTVMAPVIQAKSGNSRFDNYVLDVVKNWGYTRYGRGVLKIAIDVPKRKVIVDGSGIRKAEPEPGRPEPTIAPARNLVKAFGFNIVEGRL